MNEKQKIITLSDSKDTFMMGDTIYATQKGVIKPCQMFPSEVITLNLYSAYNTEQLILEAKEANPMYKDLDMLQIYEIQRKITLSQIRNELLLLRMLKSGMLQIPFTFNDFENKCFEGIKKVLAPILNKSLGTIGVCKIFADFKNAIAIQPHLLLLMKDGLHSYTFLLSNTFSMDSERKFAFPFEHIPNTDHSKLTLKSHIERYIIEKQYNVQVVEQHLFWVSDRQAVYFEPNLDYSHDFMQQFMCNAFIQKDIVNSLKKGNV